MIRVIDREFNTLKVLRNVRIGTLQHFNSFCLLIFIYKIGVRVFYPDFAGGHFKSNCRCLRWLRIFSYFR